MTAWTPEREALRRRLREEQGLTRAAAAERLGCSPKALEQQERRVWAQRERPDGGDAWKLREALNERRKALGMTWPDFCRAYHLQPLTLHNWRRDRVPDPAIQRAVREFVAGQRKTIGEPPGAGADVVVLVQPRPMPPGLQPVPASVEDARDWLYAELTRRGLSHLKIEARWMVLSAAETVAACNALRLEHGLPPYAVGGVAA